MHRIEFECGGKPTFNTFAPEFSYRLPHTNKLSKLSAAGLLVTLGIIYGDIGTSPLYVMKAIIGKSVINEQLVLGGLSCVFWTLSFANHI